MPVLKILSQGEISDVHSASIEVLKRVGCRIEDEEFLDLLASVGEISQIMKDVQQSAAIIWLGQEVDTFAEGGGRAPIVWNKCVTGMRFNAAFGGGEIPFKSVYFTCAP